MMRAYLIATLDVMSGKISHLGFFTEPNPTMEDVRRSVQARVLTVEADSYEAARVKVGKIIRSNVGLLAMMNQFGRPDPLFGRWWLAGMN